MRCWQLVVPLAAALSACCYHGAVYSSYQQLGLDIRASTESNAPVKVSLSYERGVGALVPKRDVDGNEGEAVSIISQDDVYTTVASPKSTSFTGKLLRASSAFISGSAAVVAAAPSDYEVHVQAPDGSRQVDVVTNGGPGARIGAAFSPTARFQTPFEQELSSLFDIIGGKSVAEQKAICDRAASIVGGPFETSYRTGTSATPKTNLLWAKNDAVLAASDRPAMERRIVEAMRIAVQ